MQIVTTFNPTNASSGSFTFAQSAANGKMVVYNESSIGIRLTFQNGYSSYVPAWVAQIYCGDFGGATVTWSQEVILDSASSPLAIVVIEAYSSQEHVLNMYPFGLPRQTNIGNSLVTGVATLNNDGNPANTQFIEATVAGDSASAVSLTNNGILLLGTTANPGHVSFDNAKVTTDGLGNITATSISAATPIASLGALPGASGVSTRFGSGLHGSTDDGFESVDTAVVGGQIGLLLKQNNYFDGTNHRFMTNATAYQFDVGGSVSGFTGTIAVRTSTNASPTANAIITWGSWQAMTNWVIGSGVQSLSNGSTITLANYGNQVTATAGVTGLLMPLGSYSGQQIAILNRSGFGLTFADHTTSNVINGTGVTIQPFQARIFIWNPNDNNQWFPT